MLRRRALALRLAHLVGRRNCFASLLIRRLLVRFLPSFFAISAMVRSRRLPLTFFVHRACCHSPKARVVFGPSQLVRRFTVWHGNIDLARCSPLLRSVSYFPPCSLAFDRMPVLPPYIPFLLLSSQALRIASSSRRMSAMPLTLAHARLSRPLFTRTQRFRRSGCSSTGPTPRLPRSSFTRQMAPWWIRCPHRKVSARVTHLALSFSICPCNLCLRRLLQRRHVRTVLLFTTTSPLLGPRLTPSMPSVHSLAFWSNTTRR